MFYVLDFCQNPLQNTRLPEILHARCYLHVGSI